MSNVEVVQDFYHIVDTFYDDIDDRIKCIKELSSFRLKEGLFSNLFSLAYGKRAACLEMLDDEWWRPLSFITKPCNEDSKSVFC